MDHANQFEPLMLAASLVAGAVAMTFKDDCSNCDGKGYIILDEQMIGPHASFGEEKKVCPDCVGMGVVEKI